MTIDPGLRIKCLVYIVSYVMNHTESDIKGFVCIFLILDNLTKLLPGVFMIVLFHYYALFYIAKLSSSRQLQLQLN